MTEYNHDISDQLVSDDELKALENLRFSFGFRHHCFHPDNGLSFEEFNQLEEERRANYIAERREAFYEAQQASTDLSESEEQEQV